MAVRRLDEHESKTLMARHGLAIPRMVLLPGSFDDLEFPVVLKAISPEIGHKTEIGAVVVDIRNEEQLSGEVRLMGERLPEARLMVEEMVPPGVEAIVGIIDDQTFGRVIMVGLGGVLAELLKDTTFRKLPIDGVDASEMVGDLRHQDLFRGFRGSPDVIDALVDTLLRVSGAAEAEDIVEMDLNPVILNENGAVVVDAKISIEIG